MSLTKYDTVSIVLEKPFVTATVSSSTILKGDDLYIRGTATGDPPSGVAIWIFGKNYWNGAAVPMQYSGMVTETVNDDNSFEYLLESAETKNLSAGQYYVVVQHPMYNGQFDVITDAEEQWVIVKDRLNIYYNSFVVWGVGYLQGSDASEALIDGINSPYVDDTYYKLSFIVENPWIKIDSISDHHAGDLFTISGTTNLDVGTEIVIALTDSFFQVSEEKTDDFSNISSTVQVVEGINYNEWSLDIDTSDFSENNYKVQAESIEFNVSATANFSIINSSIPIPTPTPTPVKPVSKDIGAAIVSASASPDKSEYEIKEPVCIKANAELESSGDQTFPAPHSLKAYTELDNPEWHYIIKINGHGEEQVTKGKNLIISGYLLEYPSDKNEIKIEYLLEGNIPEINEISNQTLIGLSQIDSSGNIASSGPFLLQRTVYPDLPDPQYKYEKIILNNGWNFISTPKKLDPSGGNNTAGKLFGNVDSGGHSALMYNGSNGGWDAVKADTIIKPLDALWIYSNSTENQDIYLTFDSNPLQTPPSKHLSAGWNTLGYSSTKSATTRDTLIDVSEKWTKVIGWDAEEQNFEDTIISGGSGNYADSRSMLPGKGYWVWMKDEGTIASLAINSMEV
ncbi:hypothetical protein [Methanoplanus limicola]|uniref:hypothetical protein n=1 Tax=Methanoplanus limicola TaxID=2315 RepID=UPI0012F680C3|nr:hypothetical protein [Methanoplanus limicola]